MAGLHWWSPNARESYVFAQLLAAAAPARLGPIYVTAGAGGGDVNPDTAGVWVPLAGPGGIAVPAAAGDRLSCTARFLSSDAGGATYDLAVAVAGALVWFASSGSTTPALEGDPALYPVGGTLAGKAAVAQLVVGAPQLEGDGAVHFVLAIKAAGTGKTYYCADYPLRWAAVNHGPAPT